ncbi:MAG: OmpA family protein [Bacteroidia bacterium]|nr:OmpA family protein [Bacteroidia bacterium]
MHKLRKRPNIPSGAYSFKTIPGNYELIFAGDLYEPNIEYVSVPSTYNLPDIIVNGLLIPKEVSSGEYYIIRNIYFDFNSYEPSREAKIELEKLNKLISENPSLFLEIIGHTDSKGSVQYNKELSIKRARSVFEYLIDIGVDNKLFIGKGVGATESVAFNTNPDGSDNPETYHRR